MPRKNIECTDAELAAWTDQATTDGKKSVSQWIRDTLNNACQNKPAETLPGWGDHNRTVKCLWCGHEQSTALLDCEQCGEDEFTS